MIHNPIRNPIRTYKSHFAVLGPRATHKGAIDRTVATTWIDFNKILKTGRRLIVTATMGRGVKLER